MPQEQRLLIGLFLHCAITGDPAHPKRLVTFELDATTPGDPTHLPVWQQHAILHSIFTLGLKRAPDRRIPSRTILGMNVGDERRVIQARVWHQAKQSASLFRHPNLISYQIPHPHAQVGGLRSETHTPLAVAQRSLRPL